MNFGGSEAQDHKSCVQVGFRFLMKFLCNMNFDLSYHQVWAHFSQFNFWQTVFGKLGENFNCSDDITYVRCRGNIFFLLG